MQIENENLFRTALTGGINLFLGAGFSVLAKNARGESLPIGSEFAGKLLAKFSKYSIDPSLPLPAISTIIKSHDRAAFINFARETYRVTEFDSAYDVVSRLNVKSIFTTNVDNLIPLIADRATEWYLRDAFLAGPTVSGKRSAHYFALHGSVLHSERDLVFGATEIASAFGKDPQLWNHFAQVLSQRPTLFWGYGLEDSGTLQAVATQTGAHAKGSERWIVVHPSAKASEPLYRALGFSIIHADTLEILDYFASLEGTSGKMPSPMSSAGEEDFPEYAVPKITSVVARELDFFFMGAEPSWFDIYQNGPAETSQFKRCQNALASRRNLVVRGIPFSGKSTILKMLAAHSDLSGRIRLFSQYLDGEEAKLLKRRLAGRQATLFLDNAFDSLPAIEILEREPNIQIVAADRDYTYQSVFHKIAIENYEVLDITDLDPLDVQKVRDKIPPTLRARRTHLFPEPAIPSIFEVVEAFTNVPRIEQRITQMFAEADSFEPIIPELLVLFAYLHHARIPVSYDLLISYCGLREIKVADVRSYLDMIGKLVVEYEGAYTDASQDYFASRSQVFAERSIVGAPPPILRAVLENLHREISIVKIANYDVFQRHGFDNEIFARAFPDWRQGKDLYDYVYERDVDLDRSPYIMQQCALYLSRKGIHKQAFAAIDEALRRSRNRIFSIRNTHAVVLFRANVEQPEDDRGNVLASLMRSMAILEECYKNDRRKHGHALTFGRQAKKFFDRYGDSQAVSYLETARSWMTDELTKSPFNRELKRALGDVRSCLGQRAAD